MWTGAQKGRLFDPKVRRCSPLTDPSSIFADSSSGRLVSFDRGVYGEEEMVSAEEIVESGADHHLAHRSLHPRHEEFYAPFLQVARNLMEGGRGGRGGA